MVRSLIRSPVNKNKYYDYTKEVVKESAQETDKLFRSIDFIKTRGEPHWPGAANEAENRRQITTN